MVIRNMPTESKSLPPLMEDSDRGREMNLSVEKVGK